MHNEYEFVNITFVRFIKQFINLIWPLGQAVKTPPFHGGNTGSNPVGVTMFVSKVNKMKLTKKCAAYHYTPVKIGRSKQVAEAIERKRERTKVRDRVNE